MISIENQIILNCKSLFVCIDMGSYLIVYGIYDLSLRERRSKWYTLTCRAHSLQVIHTHNMCVCIRLYCIFLHMRCVAKSKPLKKQKAKNYISMTQYGTRSNVITFFHTGGFIQPTDGMCLPFGWMLVDCRSIHLKIWFFWRNGRPNMTHLI